MSRRDESGGPGSASGDPGVGLCALCAHARSQTNARGSRFWRCALGETDPRFRRYPPLPVRVCSGFRAARDDC